jgi:hypothetical protein
MHGGVDGAVSGDDDVIGEPDGETGGDDGVGWMGQVICIYPYVPLIHIVLLFVSPHFIESKYCYNVEMAEALRRHKAGLATVIPIILRPYPWQDAPFAHLQPLPQDGRAITL